MSQLVTFDPTNQDVLLKTIDEFGVVESGACPANCTMEPLNLKVSNGMAQIL